ncbi:MAG: glucans biosynthesis glucosyltransferase MdoH [Thalassobaculum sp.]|uniref:glucans biosynthesis glucosyltransferase MdoH n=1 Tax=Thalassobaculum sp. TaxID=2022740 RepID=UPI0032EEC289
MPRSEPPPSRRVVSPGTVFVRVALTLLVTATTGAALLEFRELFPSSRLNAAEIALLVVFPVLIAWLAANFWIAALGAASLLRRRIAERGGPPPGDAETVGRRLVVLMPIYNEDTDRVFAGLRAMVRSLDAEARLAGFHLFVLSDTRDPVLGRREELACSDLIRAVGGESRIFYRRRARNTGRKAGNIQDFCERWGGHYDYMLVLDADSLMDGATVLRMADRMDADPRLGLLQTWPRSVRARSLFGRLQQFATSVQGQPIAEGLAVLMGDTCTYWGHNAMIRVRAFAASCGLPVLPGSPPIGGEILSHDFVEAALLVADGWKVKIMSDRAGSFEEPPPSLIASAVRDRRWAQGNLQHLQLVAAQGLAGMSRYHFLMGVMAYLASPIWLLFLVLGTVQILWAADVLHAFDVLRPIPFVIPRSADLRILIGLPLILLLLPRAFGMALILADRDLRRGHGGVLCLTVGTLLEIVVTTLVAPVMMLLHSRFVAEILAGRNSGWGPQRRDGDGEPFGQVLRVHAVHTLVGIAAALAVAFVSLEALAWLAPIVVGLTLAVPVSWLSGRESAGQWLHRLGLFRVPEEADPPAVVAAVDRELGEGAWAAAPVCEEAARLAG